MSMEDVDYFSSSVGNPRTPPHHLSSVLQVLDTPELRKFQPVIELSDSEPEQIPPTQLDSDSSTNEDEGMHVDFTEKMSPSQWSTWITVYGSEAKTLLHEECTGQDSPRSRELKTAVQAQFFAWSLRAKKDETMQMSGTHLASARSKKRSFRLHTKYGRCEICCGAKSPRLFWRGPQEGLVSLRCRSWRRCLTARLVSDRKIPQLPKKLVEKINFLRSSPRFHSRFPHLKTSFQTMDMVDA